MIAADQPICFDDKMKAIVSSVDDGQMQLGWTEPGELVVENRRRFLSTNGLDVDRFALVRVRYATDRDYCTIKTIDDSDVPLGMYRLAGSTVDCLITNQPGVGLFLPVADCIAAIYYDNKKQVLALAHLGRHSTIANLAEKLVGHMVREYDTNPSDLKVWMSPSIQKPSYRLERIDFVSFNPHVEAYCQSVDGGYLLDMQGYNRSRLLEVGVKDDNIIISEINTATDSNYWSHFVQTSLKKQPVPPRFAVACQLV